MSSDKSFGAKAARTGILPVIWEKGVMRSDFSSLLVSHILPRIPRMVSDIPWQVTVVPSCQLDASLWSAQCKPRNPWPKGLTLALSAIAKGPKNEDVSAGTGVRELLPVIVVLLREFCNESFQLRLPMSRAAHASKDDQRGLQRSVATQTRELLGTRRPAPFPTGVRRRLVLP